MRFALQPPRLDTWSIAELSAEMLRGSVTVCGPGHRLLSWPETPRVRLTALAPWTLPDRIAVLDTAAWVWGAMCDPGRPLQLSTFDGVRAPTVQGPDASVHQYRYRDEEIVQFGEFFVTSPARTVHDLLRLDEPVPPARRVACRLLLAATAGGAETVRAATTGRSRPHNRRVLERLAAL